MKIHHLLLFLLNIEITHTISTSASQEYITDPKISCNITSLHEKKSRLMSKKRHVQAKIQNLWDKTNNQEADTSEAAKLKSFLNELKSIDRKLIRLERLLQKQLCRFL